MVNKQLPPGYRLDLGSGLDRSLLVKFMQRTYQEIATGSYGHLAQTVENYLSRETPLWWVREVKATSNPSGLSGTQRVVPIACLWMGTAIDQLRGDRHTHIFLLYVEPAHRRRGIGSALMHQAEDFAQARGDRQVGLQVFQSNRVALQMYENLGYQVQSLWMVKPLG